MELKNSLIIIRSMNTTIENIYKNLQMPTFKEEIVTTLLTRKNIKIEFINSNSIKNGTIYIQEEDEWVILLEGEATLEVAQITHTLKNGDYLFIPAKVEHRVLFTNEKALWLAVHIF
jgi:cupin 2 domain-containing protein